MPKQTSHQLSTSVAQVSGLVSGIYGKADELKKAVGGSLEKKHQDLLDSLANQAAQLQAVALSLSMLPETQETTVYGTSSDSNAVTPGVPRVEDIESNEEQVSAMKEAQEDHDEASEDAKEKTAADAKKAADKPEKPAKAKKTSKAKAAK